MDVTHQTGPIIATLKLPQGDVPIYLSRLKAYAETQPDQSLERSLEDLIEFELLVHDAYASGVQNDPEVQYARNKAMVRRYLKDGFEREWTPREPTGQTCQSKI